MSMKHFIIKHVFKDVKNQLIEKEEGTEMIGPVENHFGVEWRLRLYRTDYRVNFHLDCLHPDQFCDWSIKTRFDVFLNRKKIKQTKECTFFKHCRSNDHSNDMTFSKYKKNSTNDNMTVEFRVTVRKMTGTEQKKLRNFDDDAAKEHSDVMLKIGDRKFNVYKSYLSLHSSYFRALFSGNFSESGKSEIELKDIEAKHLQRFLEVIYGEPAIDENNYLEVLKLADFFDSKTAIRRCEGFLVNKTVGSLKTKFQLANKYEMDELKNKCISDMKTSAEFRSIVPEDANEIDNNTWKQLFLKATNFF